MGHASPSIDVLRKAVESRDAAGMKALSAADAVLTIIDTINPPNRPRVVKGAAEIGSYLDDACGRDMTHELEFGVVEGNRPAFLERCAYPDGVRAAASCTAELGPGGPGGIVRQTTVQAWDS
jgi:hypothetical protein